jgi:hypothetical protein
MKGIRYAEGLKVLPVLAPVDTAASAVSSESVNLREAQWVTFLVNFGNMTSDTTDTVTLTVESSTGSATAATDEAIAFNYRVSSAVATDSMGAITAATSDGFALTSTDDNKCVVIDVDPAYVAAKDTDAQFIRVVATPSAAVAICLLGAIAVIEPRYPGNSMNSAT